MGTDLGIAPIEHRPNKVEAYREKREGGEEPLINMGIKPSPPLNSARGQSRAVDHACELVMNV